MKKETRWTMMMFSGESLRFLFSPPLIFFFMFCSFIVSFVSGESSNTSSNSNSNSNSFVMSSFHQPFTQLEPFDWDYFRVELQEGFSSLSLALETTVNLGTDGMRKLPESMIPLVCYRRGGPPIPDMQLSPFDIKEIGIFHVGGGKYFSNRTQCFFLQKKVMMTLTNEQFSPGVLYFGLFNGIGSTRTQSKMISRGSTYGYNAQITVSGCAISSMIGPSCNQTANMISCSVSTSNVTSRDLLYEESHDQTSLSIEKSIMNYESRLSRRKNGLSRYERLESSTNMTTCENSNNSECFLDGQSKLYTVDLPSNPILLELSIKDLRLNWTSTNRNSSSNSSGSAELGGIRIIVIAKHSTIPSNMSYDYIGDLNASPLAIQFPKVGDWFIWINVVNGTASGVQAKEEVYTVCFSFNWRIVSCLEGKGGDGCNFKSHILERVPIRGSGAFASYYVPNSTYSSSAFLLEPLLSNSISQHTQNGTWSYFLVNIPSGAAGGSLQFKLISNVKKQYEIYVRLDGLPSSDVWDYRANGSSLMAENMFMVFNNTSEETVNFYILYPTEGTWYFGIKDTLGTSPTSQVALSITLSGCPSGCNKHGTCDYSIEQFGITLFSYCSCDRTHGGFDCSIKVITEGEYMWQAIALIASNIAAALPALKALHQKAFAEWVIFTAIGASSALYHSCDVGKWCALSFRVLQFMDFWLSFVAVTSTFLYMALINEASKRSIHSVIFITTALVAVTGPTRPINVVIILAIGTLCLLIGWLIEYFAKNGWSHLFTVLRLDFRWRLEDMKLKILNVLRTLKRRYRWVFMFLGFIFLSLAAMSWELESSQTYWIWHSLWHVTIFTSSFFFLCSPVPDDTSRNNEHVSEERDYELVTHGQASTQGETLEP